MTNEATPSQSETRQPEPEPDYLHCIHRDECMNGNRYGKGCYEDELNNAMGGKPWFECRCGIDKDGNPPAPDVLAMAEEAKRLAMDAKQMLRDACAAFASDDDSGHTLGRYCEEAIDRLAELATHTQEGEDS